MTNNSTERSDNTYNDHKQNITLIPELRFEEFNQEWDKYTLGDLVEKVVAGATPKTSIEEYWDGGDIPWLSSGEVHKKRITFTDKFITKEGYDNSSTKMIPINSVLIALAGQGKTRGTVAINKIKLCTNQSIASIIPDKNKLDYQFLYYYLESKYEYLRRLSSSDGGRGGLNLKLIRSVKINVPSIDEQRKISSIISVLEDKITLMEKKYQMLINLKKYFLYNMISSYKEINPLLRFNEFKESWNKIRLKENLDLIRNGSSETQVNYETDYPVSRIETVSGDKLNLDKVGYVEHIEEEYKIKKGDILLTNINSMKFIGNVLYFDTDETLYHGMNLLLLRFNENINKKFMFYNLKRNNILFKKMACQAVNQASINKTTIEKMQFNIPFIKEQEKIAEFLFQFDKKIENIYKQIQLNTNFKKSLLSKMFC